MPTFEYQALNSAGERVSGVVAGGSMEQALTSLSSNGLTVERINQSVLLQDPLSTQAVVEPSETRTVIPPPVQFYEAPGSQAGPSLGQERSPTGPSTEQRSYIATSVVGPLAGTVPHANLTFFYRQFGTMLEAGVPIVQALDTLGKQGHNAKLHQVVSEIRGHVEAGRDISVGMQRYPEVFQPLAVSLVRAGEEGGFVAQAFKQLSEYTDKEISLRNLIRRLTLYPKIVLFTAVVLIGGVTLLVRSIGGPQLLPTAFVMTVSAVLGIALVAGFLFFTVGIANPRIKYNWDMITVKMPFGVGKTVHEFAMAKFGMAMAFLHKGGVPVQNSIRLSADACGNEYVRSQIVPASRKLETGAGITDTLRGTQAFSPIVMDMVDTGERTGNLDSMLMRMSTFYEDEAETRARQVAQIFSVILLALVAIYVCIILIMFWQNYMSAAGAGAGVDSSTGGD